MKHSATTAATTVDSTVAKSIVEGEGRPLGFAKYSATTAAEVVAPPVVKSVGEARLREIAKYSATNDSHSGCRHHSGEGFRSSFRAERFQQRVVEHDCRAHSLWMCQDSFWRLRRFSTLIFS